MSRSIRVAFSFCLLASIAVGAGLTEAERLKRIEEEVAKRREARVKAVEGRGVVYQPLSLPENWSTGERELKISDAPLGLCGQTFAILTRKEVLISRRVVDRKISVSLSNATREEAAEAFRRALAAQGVAMVVAGTDTVALVDASEVANEKNR